MADDKVLFVFDRFAGINNVEKSFRLPVVRDSQNHKQFDMAELENLDIDNSMVLSTRPGSDLKLSGTDMHSLWSDGNLTCLYVDSDVLYSLSTLYAATALGTVGSGRMSYAPWNDRVYMTNGSYIGYYHNNTLNLLTDPGVQFKLPLPAGRFICYFLGRLYVAKGRVLYISDAMCDHYDIRTGFRVFENDITLLAPVDKGIYLADGLTYFLSEKRAFADDPAELRKLKVLDCDAIPYTAREINGKDVADGTSENYAMWASTDGIIIGDSDGKIKNLTHARYSMPACGMGGAVVRNIDGTVHYITTLQ